MADKRISELTAATELQPTDEVVVESGGQTYKADLSLFNLSVTKSADYTITDTDGYKIIEVDDTSTDRTITLPTVADNSGRIITITNISSDGGTVTIDGEGAETISGSTTVLLTKQYGSCTIRSDGSEWVILNSHKCVDVLWTGSETTGTHSLDSGKFSDYDLLIFYVASESDYASGTISSNAFIGGKNIFASLTSNYRKFGYVSDTSFAILSGSGYSAIRIEGVKL